MRFIKFTAILNGALASLAACGREDSNIADPALPVEAAAIPASDSLPLPASPTGVTFWSHPTLPFNGLIIVSDANGVTGYNVEDGNEVAKTTGVNADGAAVSYLGYGQEARGLLAFYDRDASAISVSVIDNSTRVFRPINGDIAIRGEVRGFCFGRAEGVFAPSLHVIQKGKLARYDFTADNETVNAIAAVPADVPSDIVACAVDGADGVLILASDTGEVFRFADGAVSSSPISNVAISATGGMGAVSSSAEEGAARPVTGAIALLDQSNGVVHFADRDDGHALGSVQIAATDELEGVANATTMGITGANMGGLYRNGIIALGVDGDSPSLRLAPVGGAFNALSVTIGDPFNPRGEPPPVNDENGLLIETGFSPE